MKERKSEEGVEIPYVMLSEDVLRSMLEEFVLREGTDYGHHNYTLEEKINQVRNQLIKGKIKIIFHAGDESFDLISVNRV